MIAASNDGLRLVRLDEIKKNSVVNIDVRENLSSSLHPSGTLLLSDATI